MTRACSRTTNVARPVLRAISATSPRYRLSNVRLDAGERDNPHTDRVRVGVHRKTRSANHYHDASYSQRRTTSTGAGDGSDVKTIPNRIQASLSDSRSESSHSILSANERVSADHERKGSKTGDGSEHTLSSLRELRAYPAGWRSSQRRDPS